MQKVERSFKNIHGMFQQIFVRTIFRLQKTGRSGFIRKYSQLQLVTNLELIDWSSNCKVTSELLGTF